MQSEGYNSRQSSSSADRNRSLTARAPTNRSPFLGDASEDEEEMDGSRRRKKESFLDLLDSEPPASWSAPTSAPIPPPSSNAKKNKFSFPTLLRRVASSSSSFALNSSFKPSEHDEQIFRGTSKNNEMMSSPRFDDDPFARSLPGHTRKLTATRIDSDSDYSDYGSPVMMKRNDSATSSEGGRVHAMMERMIGYAPDSADENERETIEEPRKFRNGDKTVPSNFIRAPITPTSPASQSSQQLSPNHVLRSDQLHHQRSLALLPVVDPAVSVLPPVRYPSKKVGPTINTLVEDPSSAKVIPTATTLQSPPLTGNSMISFTSAVSRSPDLIPIPDSTLSEHTVPNSTATAHLPASNSNGAATESSESARRLSILLRSRQRSDSSNSTSSIVRNRPARTSSEAAHRRTFSESSRGRAGSTSATQRARISTIEDNSGAQDADGTDSTTERDILSKVDLLPPSPPLIRSAPVHQLLPLNHSRSRESVSTMSSSYHEEIEQLAPDSSTLLVEQDGAQGRSERVVSALRELNEALEKMMELERPFRSLDKQTLRSIQKQTLAASFLLAVILDEECDEVDVGGRNESITSDYGVHFERKWL